MNDDKSNGKNNNCCPTTVTTGVDHDDNDLDEDRNMAEELSTTTPIIRMATTIQHD